MSNTLSPRSTMVEILPYISGMYQMGVIDLEKSNHLVNVTKESAATGNFSPLFSAVRKIYDDTENILAKRLLDLLFDN